MKAPSEGAVRRIYIFYCSRITHMLLEIGGLATIATLDCYGSNLLTCRWSNKQAKVGGLCKVTTRTAQSALIMAEYA